MSRSETKEMEMEFQRLLLQIGQSLGSEDTEALVFLCTDVTQRSLKSVELFSDLCSILSDQDLLSPERPELLQELLQTIHRPRLLRDHLMSHQGHMIELISPYRKLLYNLSEDITDGDLRNIKFLLNKELPRRKLDENVTTLELFLFMEHTDLLSEFDLDLLQKIFESVSPMLNEKINNFKKQAMCVGSAEQRNVSPSMSFPVEQNQVPYGGSNISGFTQLSLNPPNASVDSPCGLSSFNDSGMSPQQVRDSNIVTNNSSLKDCTYIPEKPASVPKFDITNCEEIGTYPMTGEKRGICLIVNNYNFDNKKPREGTQIDQECLERVFQWLGFEVEVHPDCTRDMMLSVMKDVSSRDHRNMDCVVCCILSHGQEESVFGVDGQTVPIKQLTMFLNGSKCPSLVNKPKLFFIQACQGIFEQNAVSIETDGPTPCGIESDAAKFEDSIPSDADFLLGMATVPSFVSYRGRSSGSWFIQALCKNLVQMVPRQLDLVSILTKVNADVSLKTADRDGPKKQMPQPAFSLRKKVIFPVPTTCAPSLAS
ncbi:caspase-8 [Eucyclogobius newberryi]|uniref:caspase-8 n=1 Tax=Eucyclogobius newberryi TaxID=166745 RepID=UPI003B5A9636